MNKKLNDLINSETEFYLRNRAIIHLEAALGSLLDVFDIKEVASLLRDHADHLEEHH